ncbi:hypothetical protein [Microlunatus sp. GCM10028923]|uniref:hypothetical protein n=1 Tax=Microlunatus sp. GCM10028923 TaxID=3273400 RepID=UPI003615443A
MAAEDVTVAYAAFVERVSAALADDQARNQLAVAFQQYATLADQALAPLARPAFESYRGMLRRQLSSDQVRPRVDEAFGRFTRALGSALATPPTEPAELAAIAEAMLGAAWLAAAAAADAEEAPQETPDRPQHDPPPQPEHPGVDAEFIAAASVWGPTTVLE